MLLHRFWSRVICFAVLFLSLLAPLGAAAAPASLQLDGQNGVILPGNAALDLAFAGTIEFWIAPAWASSIDHDPTVIANVGETGVRYSIHVTSDRKAIGLHAGENWQTVPFDFTDGRLHHVAMTTLDGVTDVVVDGSSRGLLGMEYDGSIAGQSFAIGSFDGKVAPFKGTLAGLRIWNTPLVDLELNRFSKLDVDDSAFAAHPALRHLVAAGVVQNGRLVLRITPPKPIDVQLLDTLDGTADAEFLDSELPDPSESDSIVVDSTDGMPPQD